MKHLFQLIGLKLNSFAGEKAEVLIKGKVVCQQFVPDGLEVLSECHIHVLNYLLFFKIPAHYVSLVVNTLQVVVHISCEGCQGILFGCLNFCK